MERNLFRPRFSGVMVTLAMLALTAIGLMAIHVSEQAEGLSLFAKRQALFVGLGLAAFAVFVSIPYRRFGQVAYPFFGIMLVVLLLLAYARVTHQSLPLIEPSKGAYRWVDLGYIKIQPSEIAKLSLILLLAWYLRMGDHYRTLLGLVPLFVMTMLPMGLILIEPDLGTSLLFLPMLYVMLFMAGAKLRHLLGIVAAGTILVLLPIPLSTAGMSKEEIQERQGSAYWVHRDDDGQAKTMVLALPLAIMESHQLRRIDGWLHQVDRVDPENKRAVALTQGWGYQLHQSKIVIGSGRALGSGDWEEAEIYFRMLPDDHTDFIFSIIGGQWGFLGCCAVLVLYGVIILFGVEIAASTHDAFGRLLAVGVVGMLLSQILVNIGMTIGLLPITGMTLPLISYGGSSLLVNCAALGLLVNVGQHRPISYARRPFEHKQNTKPVPSGPLEAGRKPTAVGNGGNGAHRG